MHHVIIGSGPAGVAAAEAIRRADRIARITLVGDEPEPPYSRMAIPYLLTGRIGEAGTHLRKSADHYAGLDITLLPGRKMTGLEPARRRIALDDGTALGYDRLLIATGARPTRPPIEGLDLPGVHNCWTLADARRIAALARPGSHVVLMGAGFVGTIVLEALAMRGVGLTVVEMGDRMVPRMMDETSGGMLKSWCIAKGVDVRTGTRIARIAQGAGSLSVELADGGTLPAHLVVVCAGVRSNVECLDGSGIDIAEGVLVDDHLRTSLPHVFAAGDVCQGRDIMTGERQVHAIQPTATEHGRVAGTNMAGGDLAFIGSLNMNVLDTLGLISCSFGQWMGQEGGEQARVVDPDRFRYLRLEFLEDRLIGANAVGMTREVGILRGLIQTRIRLGGWLEKLKKNPCRLAEAYVAVVQGH